jgi:hypothetical protein
VRISTSLWLIISSVILTACATSFLKFDKPEQLKKIEEFDDQVKITNGSTPVSQSSSKPLVPTAVGVKDTVKVISSNTGPVTTAPKVSTKSGTLSAAKEALHDKKKTKSKTTEKKESLKEAKTVSEKKQTGGVGMSEQGARQPELEDSEGFLGRRPVRDPYRVGEEVIHDVHYFKVSAGELHFKLDPFVSVNERKSYAFKLLIKTSALFSSFYSVDDTVDVFMDYETLTPNVFQLHVTESGQLREAKMLFNDQDNTATYWEKKVTKKDGVEEKKQQWDILPFSQNVYSAIFYMRFFKWEVGKEYSFRVANDKENLVFSGKALRKEVLETKLGPMKAIVVTPNIHLKGKFQPIGENLIWLSDDEHRYILRIEAKIKIGTLISEVTEIR